MPYAATCNLINEKDPKAIALKTLLLTEKPPQKHFFDLFDPATINEYIATTKYSEVTPLGFALYCEDLPIIEELVKIKGLNVQRVAKDIAQPSKAMSAIAYCFRFLLSSSATLISIEKLKKIIICLLANTEVNLKDLLTFENKIHSLNNNDSFKKFLEEICAYIKLLPKGETEVLKQSANKIKTWCVALDITDPEKGILKQLISQRNETSLSGLIIGLYEQVRLDELDKIIYERFNAASESGKNDIYKFLLNFQERIINDSPRDYYATVMAIDTIAPYIFLALQKIGKPCQDENQNTTFFPRFLKIKEDKLEYNKSQEKITPPRYIAILRGNKSPQTPNHSITLLHEALVGNDTTTEARDLRNGLYALYAFETAKSQCYQAIQFFRRVKSLLEARFHTFIAYTHLFLQKPEEQKAILVELSLLLKQLNPEKEYHHNRILNESLVAMIIATKDSEVQMSLFEMLVANLQNHAESNYFKQHCLPQISSFFENPAEIDARLIKEVYAKDAKNIVEIIKLYEQTNRQALLAPLYRILAKETKAENNKTVVAYYLRAFRAGDAYAAVPALNALMKENPFNDATNYIHLLDEALLLATQQQDSAVLFSLLRFIRNFSRSFGLLTAEKNLLKNIIHRYWTQNPFEFTSAYQLKIEDWKNKTDQLSIKLTRLAELLAQIKKLKGMMSVKHQLAAFQAENFISRIPAKLVKDINDLIEELRQVNQQTTDKEVEMKKIELYRDKTTQHKKYYYSEDGDPDYLPDVLNRMYEYLNRSAWRKGSIRRKIYLALKVLILLPGLKWVPDKLGYSAEQIATAQEAAKAYLQKKTDEASQYPKFARWALGILNHLENSNQILLQGIDAYLREEAKNAGETFTKDLEHAVSKTYYKIYYQETSILHKTRLEVKNEVALHYEELEQKVIQVKMQYENQLTSIAESITNQSAERNKILEITCNPQTSHSASVIDSVIMSLTGEIESERFVVTETTMPSSSLSSSSSSSSSSYQRVEGQPDIEFKRADLEIEDIMLAIEGAEHPSISISSSSYSHDSQASGHFSSSVHAPSAPEVDLVYPSLDAKTSMLISSSATLARETPQEQIQCPPGGLIVSSVESPADINIEAEAKSERSSTSAISSALNQSIVLASADIIAADVTSVLEIPFEPAASVSISEASSSSSDLVSSAEPAASVPSSAASSLSSVLVNSAEPAVSLSILDASASSSVSVSSSKPLASVSVPIPAAASLSSVSSSSSSSKSSPNLFSRPSQSFSEIDATAAQKAEKKDKKKTQKTQNKGRSMVLS